MCVHVSMLRFVVRPAIVAMALGLLGACDSEVQDAAGEPAAGEDDLTFRATAVDESLPDVDAIGYEVDLRVDDTHGSESYRATVKGTYVATRDLTEVSLDFEGPHAIEDVRVGARAASHREDQGTIVVALPVPVAKGKTFTTRIRYSGSVAQADGSNPNDFDAFGGLMVRQRNADGKRIYTSLDWPHKARRWLPLRDHPSDGAMLAMTATFPRSFVVVANGKKTKTDDNADGTRTWRYEALTPMPPYDFHVAAYEDWSEDDARSPSGVPIATFTYASAHPRAAEVFGDLPKVLDFYERSFGRYAFGSASFLEEPIFGGGMEHASVVSMDETLFSDPEGARKVAFHELGHHWSGNLARIRTWNDFWLSEGFTEYLTARAIGEVDGPAAQKAHLRDYLRRALAADRTSPHPIRPPDPEVDVLTIFDAISYQKGALTLRLLERVLGGPAPMTAFLRGWFDRHAFGAVSTKDLEAELSAAADKDLGPVFAGFVYGTGHPEVRVSLAAAAGGDVDVKVEQTQAGGPAAGFVFPLDVDLVDDAGHAERVSIDVDARSVTKRAHVARAPARVVVDPDEVLVGTIACDAAQACKDGYRCSASQCVP